MERRYFMRTAILGGMALGLGCKSQGITHILTLSFDDGFKKSFYETADIFEKYRLRACLNVIASGHLSNFSSPDKYHINERGDFTDWNTLKKRGHEIMPHSWDHSNLAEMLQEQAKEDIIKCLDYFRQNLDGFDESKAVYNFAYNASTPELVDFALTRVRAVRTGGWNIWGDNTTTNPFPYDGQPRKLGCWSYGPDNADKWVEEEVNLFLDSSGGWLVLNLHGLDKEGWGPVSSVYLDNLLGRLVKIKNLRILPAGIVLDKYA